MARTAAPATPGTDPTAPATPGDAAEALAPVVAETPEQKVERMEREMADLRSLVHTLGRNQVAKAAPEQVEHPELDKVMKQKPDVPVLTKQGWYVPSILPSQRKVD